MQALAAEEVRMALRAPKPWDPRPAAEGHSGSGVRTQSTLRTRVGVIPGESRVPNWKSTYVRAFALGAVALHTYGLARVNAGSIAHVPVPHGIRVPAP